MLRVQLKKGVTSRSIYLFIADSTVSTGAGKTGLAYNTASLAAYYARPRSTPVAITLVTQTVTGAYSSGGFVEVDATNMPGLYRLDVPDGALATGQDSVVVMLKGATGMAPVVAEIELVDYDPFDAQRAGLAALPSSGGVLTGATVIETQGSYTLQVRVTDGALADTATVTITFSEKVADFSNADVTVAKGSLGTLSSADGGITWTGTFTPTANLEDVTNVITLTNTYTDLAGNTGSTGTLIDTLSSASASRSAVSVGRALSRSTSARISSRSAARRSHRPFNSCAAGGSFVAKSVHLCESRTSGNSGGVTSRTWPTAASWSRRPSHSWRRAAIWPSRSVMVSTRRAWSASGAPAMCRASTRITSSS